MNIKNLELINKIVRRRLQNLHVEFKDDPMFEDGWDDIIEGELRSALQELSDAQ